MVRSFVCCCFPKGLECKRSIMRLASNVPLPILLLAGSLIAAASAATGSERPVVGLVLVPVDQNSVEGAGSAATEVLATRRRKRSMDSRRRQPQHQDEEKKYHRLAHSVHVQSDIRYR